MAAGIPSDMFLHMDWNAEKKLSAWTFDQERLEQYFVFVHIPKADRLTHILFFGDKNASERWTTLKDQLSEEDKKNADKVFTAFASNFEKSSLHWQARNEYLEDIKQYKQQTTAELWQMWMLSQPQ